MPKNKPGQGSRSKDPVAIKIGKRIAQARKMAGFKSAREFRASLPPWPENRLSWYEAGYSMPHPAHVEIIAKATGTSACWIMFGLGPIRSGERDLQSVRHQNLVYLFNQAGEAGEAQLAEFTLSLALEPDQLIRYIDNPFKHIGERLSRKIERAGQKPKRWLDEQHVESDGLCAAFPDNLRELMTLFSDMDGKGRESLLAVARTLATHH